MTAPALSRFDTARSQLDNEWLGWIHESTAPTRVEAFNKDWEYVGPVDLVISSDDELIVNDAGEATVVMHGDSMVGRWALDFVDEPEDVHLVVTQGHSEPWSGKAQTIRETIDEAGVETITIKALHDWQHAKKLHCYPNPWFNIGLQWPKSYLWYGPAATGVKQLMLVNLMRHYQNGWIALPDMFSQRSYQSLNIDQWAQVVSPLNVGILHDPTPHAIITTRMGNFAETVKPILEDAGLMLTATRWLPGDPQPFADWCVLSKPTIVWDVVDKSGVRGSTGTMWDGFIKFFTNIGGDGLTETTTAVPYDPPEEYDTPGFWGTVTDAPACVFYQRQRWTGVQGSGQVGIKKWSRTVHKALAHTIVVGGKSPGWVNSALKMIANAILGWIGMIFLNPGLALGVFDEQIENVVLAFAQHTFWGRKNKMGRDGYLEYFDSSATTGFTVSTVAALRAGREATKPYTSYEFEITNGLPYFLGRHMSLGDRVSCEAGRTGKLYTDQIRSIRRRGDVAGTEFSVSIGVDVEERTPAARVGRILESVKNVVQTIGVAS